VAEGQQLTTLSVSPRGLLAVGPNWETGKGLVPREGNQRAGKTILARTGLKLGLRMNN